MGRTAWIWMVLGLLAVVFVAVLAVAWIDGGEEPLRWHEQPLSMPGPRG